MNLALGLTLAIFSGLLSIIVVIIFEIISIKKVKVKKIKKQKVYNNIDKILRTKNFYKEINEIYTDKNDPNTEIFYNHILSTYKNALADSLSNLTVKKQNLEIENKISSKIDQLSKRIQEIEKRFPKNSTLEKISSINDAVMATNVESLSESVKRIESKILTNWDIVKILFEIIAVLSVLMCIIFSIILNI